MSELVLLCNEQLIYCDNQAYYCDGSVVKLDESYSTTSYADVLAGFILCNDQVILCNSFAYYCDGSVVDIDIEYSTNTYSDVLYDSESYIDEFYSIFNFFVDSNNLFFRVSSGDFFRVRGTTDIDNVRY